MKSRMASIRPLAVVAFALSMMSLWLAPSTATAQPQFVVTPVAEKKLAQLPAGPLYWWVENFPTLAQAHAAEGPTSLAAEAAGKVWLLTLGPEGRHDRRWNQGGGGWPRAADYGARVSAANHP